MIGFFYILTNIIFMINCGPFVYLKKRRVYIHERRINDFGGPVVPAIRIGGKSK